MDTDLGRLIRTLKEKCPECHSPIQLRARKINILVRGVDVEQEEEYKVCGTCGFEIELRQKDLKKRKLVVDKTILVKDETVDDRKGRKDGYKGRESTKKNNANEGGKNHRKNNR